MPALAVVFAVAPGASAATTVGQTFAPAFPTLPEKLAFQSAVSGQPSSVIPSAGIITSFSHIAEAAPDSTLALVVLRPSGADYTVVAVSDAKTLTGGVLNTFVVRIQVQAGDLIGVLGSSDVLGAAGPVIALANTFQSGDVSPTVGATILSTSLSPFSPYIIDISAIVEADADGDLYGDETQDLCPTDASTQGACDVTGPFLTFAAKKTQKSNKAFKFSATSNEAGTLRITCKLHFTVKKNGKKVRRSYKLQSVSQTLTAGVRSKFTFRLSARVRRSLRKAGKMKAVLTFASADSLGNKATQSLTLTLKPKSK